MATDDELQAYYERDRERDRLASGIGELEFLRTTEIITRTLPAAPATVADIGGGPGRYTDWLVELGYEVIHRDVVPHHVDQVRQRWGSRIDSAVGDACDLGDIEDDSVDAVLLLGPLYHLADAADRRAALDEAARITRPGGMVYAAGITRWAARIMAILVERGYDQHTFLLDTIDALEETGNIRPHEAGHFTGYTHTPAQFRDEMTIDALAVESVLAIEGIASAFTDGDIAARLANPTDRRVLLDSIRALEAIPDLLGASSHLLATARVR